MIISCTGENHNFDFGILMTKLRGHIKNLVLFCFSFNLINVGKEIPIRRPVVIYNYRTRR